MERCRPYQRLGSGQSGEPICREADVARLENAACVSSPRYIEHCATDLACGEDLVGEGTPQQWEKRPRGGIELLIQGRPGLDAIHRLDEAGAEHVGTERQTEERIFSAAFDAGPHDATLLRAVGAGAGNVDE